MTAIAESSVITTAPAFTLKQVSPWVTAPLEHCLYSTVTVVKKP